MSMVFVCSNCECSPCECELQDIDRLGKGRYVVSGTKVSSLLY